MSNNIIFYWVFISQIVLISVYYPNKIVKRLNLLLETHPPAEFPKLYTQSVNQFNKMKQLFMILNTFMLLVGFAIIAYSFINEWMLTTNQLTGYMLLQYLPLLLLEISESKQLKLMRAADSGTIKKASINPRKLLGFVSSKIVVTATLLYITLFIVTLAFEGIHAPWFSGYGNLVAITYANLFLMGIVFWVLYGKRRNPRANEKDRLKEMKSMINVMFFASIVASVYTIISYTINQFEDLAYIQPIMTSVYFQILAYFGIGYMLRSIKMTDVDFSVYKAG